MNVFLSPLEYRWCKTTTTIIIIISLILYHAALNVSSFVSVVIFQYSFDILEYFLCKKSIPA